MKSRVDVTQADLSGALKLMGDHLSKRVSEQGSGGFISHAEMLGAVLDQFGRLQAAVNSKGEPNVFAELIDTCVESLFGAASIIANKRAAQKV